MEHGLTCLCRDISTPTASATRSGPSSSRTSNSSWTTQTTSKPRESRSLRVRARRRRSERCVKKIPSSQRGKYCCVAEGRRSLQQQHGLYADGYGGPRLRPEIVILGGCHKHPYGMSCPAKGRVDNIPRHPSTEMRYLDMHQAVSFLLRQESG